MKFTCFRRVSVLTSPLLLAAVLLAPTLGCGGAADPETPPANTPPPGAEASTSPSADGADGEGGQAPGSGVKLSGDEPADGATAGFLPTTGPGLEVGTEAPAFTLKDQDGQDRSLSALLEQGNVALVFYRSADW